MSELDWRETGFGVECDGFRVVRDEADRAKPWRLEPTKAAPYRQSQRSPQVTTHRSRDEAIRWAESAQREHIRRVVAAGHFGVAASAFASFVLLSQFIGSMGGLLLVAATLYVALRSFGNGIGVLLNDAWGWTRLGRQQSSLLERVVPAVLKWARRRRAALASGEPLRSVRELTPPLPR